MNQRMAPARPAWVSDEIFPFESNFFTTPSGHEMHFIDEGAGEPIVFLHGNPTWSFEFRHLVRDLRSRFRCIAPDHIGFGLSSRSRQPADYRPEAHADAVAALLNHLDVKDRPYTWWIGAGRLVWTSRASIRIGSNGSSLRTPGAGRSRATRTILCSASSCRVGSGNTLSNATIFS